MLLDIVYEFRNKRAVLPGTERRNGYDFLDIVQDQNRDLCHIFFFVQVVKEICDLRKDPGGQMGSQGNNNIICKLQEKILVGDGGQNAFQLPQTAFTFLGISGREQRNKMVYLFHNLSVVKGGNFSGAFNEIHDVIALYSFDQHSQQRFKIRVFLPLIINGNGLAGKGY